MKFIVGDQVLVTAGKDKGVKSEITAVYPEKNQVLVKGANLYVKHVKPMPMLNRPGERTRQERPLSTAKVAIINDQGQPDRIGYKVTADGKKVRIYKKTGKVIEVKKEQKKSAKSAKSDKKESTKKTKTTKTKTKKETKKVK